MRKKNQALLIICAYNEALCLKQVVDGVIEDLPGCDYVVINDGSTDATLSVCVDNGYNYLDLPINLGLSGAFQTGMKYAAREGYTYAIQFDGDGQHRTESIRPMLKRASESDVVIGSRFVSEPRPRSLRMMGNILISWAIKVTTGQRVNDPTSGLRLYNEKMIAMLSRGLNWDPEPDTVAYLIRNGARVEEVQVNMDERIAGESYFNLRSATAYMLKQTVSILFFQLFRGRA
ncbi:MAG: glycosyltransferase family 2 protein [Atopobiaceae bacterium]|jgi:glycosyltransferase involved in cell wall biosynthesis|nr:glycosyltransferase family 2 protein [Atopobiaceae bacterium]